MKYRITISLFLLAYAVLGRNFAHGYSVDSSALGKIYTSEVEPDALNKTPRWHSEDENPPISMRKALALAGKVREELLPDDSRYVWPVYTIELWLVPVPKPTHSFWVVTYIAVPPPSNDMILLKSGYLRLAVLMDGTVVRPEVRDAHSSQLIPPPDWQFDGKIYRHKSDTNNQTQSLPEGAIKGESDGAEGATHHSTHVQEGQAPLMTQKPKCDEKTSKESR